MNSRTSRPRSPMSAITFTSAARLAREHAEQHALADAAPGEDADALALAAREQAVDRAHARLERLVHAAGGASGGGGSAIDRAARALVCEVAAPVDRMPEPVEHAAEQPVAHRNARAARRSRCTSLPGETPEMSPSGMRRTRPARKPTTSARIGSSLRPPYTRQISPSEARGPRDSMTSPTTSSTRPLSRTGSTLLRAAR